MHSAEDRNFFLPMVFSVLPIQPPCDFPDVSLVCEDIGKEVILVCYSTYKVTSQFGHPDQFRFVWVLDRGTTLNKTKKKKTYIFDMRTHEKETHNTLVTVG